ncbi:uncharacterized protein LOC141632197 [Silene latifolia]|uniref:uncharacterized protein LOC141632197 n=1 Tax=Silene latifolia TaxID=37657 RepID=UPI003D789F2B
MADKHRSEREFQIGDWVWLSLQPYRQTSVQQKTNQKLAHKYSGPFHVEAKIGNVAYKLKLPSTAQIHNVFHVSQLKKFVGTLPMAIHIPTWLQGQPTDHVLQPAAILERRTVKSQNKAQGSSSSSRLSSAPLKVFVELQYSILCAATLDA